jgi:hypothetical protein
MQHRGLLRRLVGARNTQLTSVRPEQLSKEYDPDPISNIIISVDQRGVLVKHISQHGAEYVRNEQYNIAQTQWDVNAVRWIGLFRQNPNIIMVGEIDRDQDGLHYREWVSNKTKPWTIKHPELVTSCFEAE